MNNTTTELLLDYCFNRIKCPLTEIEKQEIDICNFVATLLMPLENIHDFFKEISSLIDTMNLLNYMDSKNLYNALKYSNDYELVLNNPIYLKMLAEKFLVNDFIAAVRLKKLSDEYNFKITEQKKAKQKTR